jgi:predicted benzoate:H+ symporter BenE
VKPAAAAAAVDAVAGEAEALAVVEARAEEATCSQAESLGWIVTYLLIYFR